MKVCFIGHRTIQKNEELISILNQAILNLINKGVTTFLFGGIGEFDNLSWEIVTSLKVKYSFIKRVFVRANHQYLNDFYEKHLLKYYEGTYFPIELKNAGKCAYVERNYKMIDCSTYCVFYYNENYTPISCQQVKGKSGTKIAYEYAIKRNKTIINTYN